MNLKTVLSFALVLLCSIGLVNRALCLQSNLTTSAHVRSAARDSQLRTWHHHTTSDIDWTKCQVRTCTAMPTSYYQCTNTNSLVWAWKRTSVEKSFNDRTQCSMRNVTQGNALHRLQLNQCRFSQLRSSNSSRMMSRQHQNGTQWSSANVELFQAILKITILVMLKIIIKYFIRGYLKAHITNKAVFELINLMSKALTIAIAKCAIKWALYPALRTASKTFLIASFKSVVKPFSSPLIKGVKGSSFGWGGTMARLGLTLAIKTVIKTLVLELLVFVFVNEATQLSLHQLMFRVSVILLAKIGAKRVCKLGKNKSIKVKQEDDPNVSHNNTTPVDKIMLFAIQKLVTKLVKIPLIKILL